VKAPKKGPGAQGLAVGSAGPVTIENMGEILGPAFAFVHCLNLDSAGAGRVSGLRPAADNNGPAVGVDNIAHVYRLPSLLINKSRHG
jgi:hypothetical protein